MRHDHCDYVDVHREDELWQLDSIPKWWDSLFQICCLIEISLFWPRWWPSTILQKSSPLFLLHLVLWPLGSKIPTCKKLEKRTDLWTGAFELQAWILELWFTTRLLLHDVGLLLGWFADSTSRAFGIHVSYHGRHFQWGSSGGKVWVKKECSSSWCGRGPRNECVMSVEYIYIRSLLSLKIQRPQWPMVPVHFCLGCTQFSGSPWPVPVEIDKVQCWTTLRVPLSSIWRVSRVGNQDRLMSALSFEFAYKKAVQFIAV